jgi:hypothetical protein
MGSRLFGHPIVFPTLKHLVEYAPVKPKKLRLKGTVVAVLN